MVYTLPVFFFAKCSLFPNSNAFGYCIIHILFTVCAKIKKKYSGAKRLNMVYTLLFFSLQNTACFIILTYLVPHFIYRVC